MLHQAALWNKKGMNFGTRLVFQNLPFADWVTPANSRRRDHCLGYYEEDKVGRRYVWGIQNYA